MDIEAQRTLVKSPPELWGLLSDAESLARQLVDLGEVRIVSTEPETAIAWEGDGIRGTIALKASGWGTKVTLTASREAPACAPQWGEPVAPPEPEVEPEAEPELTAEPESMDEPEPTPEPEPKPGFFARIFRRRKPVAAVEPEAETAVEPEPVAVAEPEAEAPEPERPDLGAELLALEESLAAETTAVLNAVLDRLGAAHHRPFSRA